MLIIYKISSSIVTCIVSTIFGLEVIVFVYHE